MLYNYNINMVKINANITIIEVAHSNWLKFIALENILLLPIEMGLENFTM